MMSEFFFMCPLFLCLLSLLPCARPCPCQPLRVCPKKYVCHKGEGGVCFSEGKRCAASKLRIILVLFLLLQVGVPLSSPALPPSLRAPLPLPAPVRAPKEVCLSQGGRWSMLLRRRALRCIRIKNHFDLIFVVAGQSALSIVLYCRYCTLLLRGKGVPANLQYQKVPTEFSSGIGSVRGGPSAK